MMLSAAGSPAAGLAGGVLEKGRKPVFTRYPTFYGRPFIMHSTPVWQDQFCVIFLIHFQNRTKKLY
jgi:hypothetical protein